MWPVVEILRGVVTPYPGHVRCELPKCNGFNAAGIDGCFILMCSVFSPPIWLVREVGIKSGYRVVPIILEGQINNYNTYTPITYQFKAPRSR
jgi:hypothetical protein